MTATAAIDAIRANGGRFLDEFTLVLPYRPCDHDQRIRCIHQLHNLEADGWTVEETSLDHRRLTPPERAA